jgi:cysteine desulfurase/selenocysteine lyase
MPIRPPDQSAPVTPESVATDDPFHTVLITQLANEYFAGSNYAPSLPAVAPGVPTALPSTPTTIAGAPSTIPDLSKGAPSAGDQALSGGYPSTAPTAPPPVHPVLEPEVTPTESTSKDLEAQSGGHSSGSTHSYDYGEPRCYKDVFRNGDKNPKEVGTNGFFFPDTPVAVSAADSVSAPEFYFIRGADVPSSLPTGSQPTIGSALSTFDIEAVRRDFPALHQRVNGKPLIWLDNAATTHKPQSVIDATSVFYSRDNSNIHRGAHALAARSTDLFEGSREKVRQFLGAADAKEIVFVRGTTEAINLVAQSYGRTNIGSGDEILLTRMEHHANIVPWQLLAQQVGAVIRVAPINDNGELIVEEFAKLLTSRTKIVGITHVSNALGTVNPLEQIIPLAHGQGVPVLVDGAQSTPHFPVSVQALNADFYVFSAHKIFGPTGIGALYGKANLLESMPPYQGGGHMIKDVTFERTIYNDVPERFEAGTPDIAGVVGLGAAIDYLVRIGIPAIAAYEHSLLEYATYALSTVPGIRPIGTAAVKASVLSFVIPGVPNEKIARYLDKQGIAVRAGHHCALPAQRHFGIEGSVRPSLALYNTREEVDTLVEALTYMDR